MASPNNYEIGDTVVCTATFTNSLGTAVDPTTVTFVMSEPDGTKTTKTYAGAQITRISAGIYTASFDPRLPTEHTYEFLGVTGSTYKRAVSKTFYVKPTPFS